LRSLFTAGALAVIRYAKIYGTKYRPWLTALVARRPTKVAAIALANKLARMAWAMTSGPSSAGAVRISRRWSSRFTKRVSAPQAVLDADYRFMVRCGGAAQSRNNAAGIPVVRRH
jgi:hypothetical protein